MLGGRRVVGAMKTVLDVMVHLFLVSSVSEVSRTSKFRESARAMPQGLVLSACVAGSTLDLVTHPHHPTNSTTHQLSPH